MAKKAEDRDKQSRPRRSACVWVPGRGKAGGDIVCGIAVTTRQAADLSGLNGVEGQQRVNRLELDSLTDDESVAAASEESIAGEEQGKLADTDTEERIGGQDDFAEVVEIDANKTCRRKPAQRA